MTVQLIRFSGAADASAEFDLFDSALDDIGALTITDQVFGLTNYEAALDRATDFFASVDPTGMEDDSVFFASDGVPTVDDSGGNPATTFLDEAAELQGQAAVTAVGFGNAGIDLATLNQVDNTGGGEIVGSAEELDEVFAASPLFNAVLVDFGISPSASTVGRRLYSPTRSVTLRITVADYSFDLAPLTGLIGAQSIDNVFTAVAVFDPDGHDTTDADQMTLTTVNTVQGAVPDLFWF